MSRLLMFLFLSMLVACVPMTRDSKPPVSVYAGECVVLLHGLGRSAASMRKMEKALVARGYSVANIDYDSRSATIEKLAESAIPLGLDSCRQQSALRMHFVTHSLGGILLRYYLGNNQVNQLGRSVMLAPPNQGSAAADAFRNAPGYRLLNGEAGLQLGTGTNSLPLQLGPLEFDVGVIAGDRTIDPLTSLFLANPDDGKVSVESTKAEGMNDFLLVHHSHAFIMKSSEVIRQTSHYLEFGHFDHSEDVASVARSRKAAGSVKDL